MSGKKKRVVQIGTAFVLVANGLAIASAIILQNIWFVVLVLGIIAFDIYLYFFRLHRKKEPRYPLVPPEGKGDVYLPRTDIPRPIHADFRKMREKRRRFEKIDKLVRKKKSANRIKCHSFVSYFRYGFT